MTEQQSNAQYIAKRFMDAGCTLAGACGAVANFDAEAGLYPCRVQGDYTYPFEASELYARQVMSGAISENQWAYDGRGWGLPQFTYWSLKKGFLEYCKAHNTYIWKIEAQCNYLIKLFKSDYAGVWQTLCTTSSARAAAISVMLQFERPADQSMSAQNYRSNLADKWLGWLTTNGTEMAEEPKQEEQKEDTANTPYWPPRVLDLGMLGTDVRLLQDALSCRGFLCTSDGIFGKGTREKLIAFQKTAFPDKQSEWDGIAGKRTWAILLTI